MEGAEADEIVIQLRLLQNEGIDAVARGLAIIDAGHYGVEKIFVPYMKEYLKREVNGVLVYTQQEEEPFWYI